MESRYVCWFDAYESDEWEFTGRNVMEVKVGYWSEDNKDGLEGDDYFPIYNYAYPLEYKPDDEIVFRICNETACTVVYNNNEDSYYLALCGCGMNFSQSIALAYMIANSFGGEEYGRIPDHMLFDVLTEGPFSVDKYEFGIIIEKLKEGLNHLAKSCRHRYENIIEGKYD